MNYVNHEGVIVLKHGVELIGWPRERVEFKNLSHLTTSLPTLRFLLQEIDEQHCYFRRLSPEELAQRQQAYDQKQQKGEGPQRKKCSDAGQKHGKKKKKATLPHDENSDDNGASGEEERPQKCPREDGHD